MVKINGLRVLAGGLLAGVVINVCEYVVNGVLLKDRWADAMTNLHRSAQYSSIEMASFIVWGFMVGLFAIWLYAAIRPRYGAGLKTAIVAGAAVWALGYVANTIPAAAMHIFPRRLLALGLVAGLVEALVATVLGAWLYKEASSSDTPSAA
ncbi:MAG: hypothetical protein ABSH05_06510 [Bryobacteraceae bacterium]|jgi:dipeptide/tripeptide permease